MATKKKSKTTTIKVGKSAFYSRMMKESGVPEDVLKVLKKQVAKEMRLLKKHMDADGWDLNFEFIKSECIAPIISNWFEWYLIAKINEKGYGLKFSKNKHTDESVFVITKKGND